MPVVYRLDCSLLLRWDESDGIVGADKVGDADASLFAGG